jgi:hypothetical protein
MESPERPLLSTHRALLLLHLCTTPPCNLLSLEGILSFFQLSFRDFLVLDPRACGRDDVRYLYTQGYSSLLANLLTRLVRLHPNRMI